MENVIYILMLLLTLCIWALINQYNAKMLLRNHIESLCPRVTIRRETAAQSTKIVHVVYTTLSQGKQTFYFRIKNSVPEFVTDRPLAKEYPTFLGAYYAMRSLGYPEAKIRSDDFEK